MIIKNNFDKLQEVPCGQCIGCRLEKASQWASRCIHEAQLYENNCFITLTYSPEHLPEDGSVNKDALKNFIRRLRNQTEKQIRYYACGEYGDSGGRPHYHALLFNYDFADKVLLPGSHLRRLQNRFSKGQIFDLYRSPELEKLWTYGFSTIGEVSYDSAGYVARYVMKKITGDLAADHYKGRTPEFAIMSRMPGIGKKWLEKYYNDVYPKDYYHINGARKRPPRYYDDQLKKIDRHLYNKIKKQRRENQHTENGLRLYQKRKYQELTTKTLKRNLKDD